MVPRENKNVTMLMQTLGGQTKSIMVFSEVAYKLQMSPVNQLFHAQNQR